MASIARRAAASALADRYFAEQCARLGPIGPSEDDEESVTVVTLDLPLLAAVLGIKLEDRRDVGLDRFRL